MDPIIKRLIIWLKGQGFRIKIPGGNERQDTFAAFCAVIRYNFFRSKWQVLLIPWRPRTPEEERNKKEMKYSEIPVQTVAREVTEETGIILTKYIFLAKREIKDNRLGHSGEKHFQHLYLSRNYDASNMRRRLSPSQPNIELPFWTDLDNELEKEISIEHLWLIQEVRRYVDQLPIPQKKIDPEKNFKPALAS
jgi:8-oxo-dGTP pyrophosphatase MutT (NUDIX family)